jgi:hypothetical protein
MQVIFAENSPSWMCITSLHYSGRTPSSSGEVERTPDEVKSIKAAQIARNEAAHLAAEERRISAREAAAEAKAHRIAETKRLRAEMSARRKEERHHNKAREALAVRIVALKERKEPPVHCPKMSSRRPPDGFYSLSGAAKVVGRSRNALCQAAAAGRIPCIHQRTYVFVKMPDVQAYLEETAAHMLASRIKNIAIARSKRNKNPPG